MRVERLTDPTAKTTLRVGGTIEEGTTQIVYRAMSDPARGAGMLLRASLIDMGISIAAQRVSAKTAHRRQLPTWLRRRKGCR